MTAIHYLSIGELAAQLRAGDTTSRELTSGLLQRIKVLDAELHAFVTVTESLALAQAERADAERSRGIDRGPLHGVPIAVKDLCLSNGIVTTGGLAVRRDFVPNYDATVVTRLQQAGAVALGKLNLAEGAMSGYNPQFTAPYNPWLPTLASGGSSSGSGVATAAGLCFAAIGTDTGGSIRFPASMCGVVGMKPSYGRVSRYGVLDLAPSMDHVGGLARSVGDAAIFMDAIAGRDDKDPTSLASSCSLVDELERGVEDLKIGFAEKYASDGVDLSIQDALKLALDALRAAGARLRDVNIPSLDDYLIAWRILCSKAAYTAHRKFYPQRAAEYGAWFRSWLAHGMACDAAELDYAQTQRTACNAILAESFDDIDVLVCPAMAGPEQRKSDIELYETPMGDFNTERQRFTIPYNFNGAPSVTVPTGFDTDGAPISVQCVAKPGRDDLAMRAARVIERAFEGVMGHPSP